MSHKEKFTEKDLGRLFWRVSYRGVFTQYVVSSLTKDGKGGAWCRVAQLTDLRNDIYTLKEPVLAVAYSTLSPDVFINEEFFIDYEEAKKNSRERFDREVNPLGKYRVARYFDDVFECYMTEVLTKTEATEEMKKLNKSPRHYVSFGICDKFK